jgi:TfoX/Sxy family transcriptional regulator of competence genes
MAYDEQLAERVDRMLADRPGMAPKKMFGGLVFMLNGNMSVGIHRDTLMVRVGPDHYEDSLTRPYCRPMDITGRPMKGFVMVDSDGVSTDRELAEWVQLGVDFASSLPAK